MITSQRTNDVQTFKNTWKKKKKSWQNQKRNQKDSILATGVNTTDTLKQSQNRSKKFDTAEIMYYPCKNKSHYTNKYLESKNQQQS